MYVTVLLDRYEQLILNRQPQTITARVTESEYAGWMGNMNMAYACKRVFLTEL